MRSIQKISLTGCALLALVGGASSSGAAVAFSNGGFEQGLDLWASAPGAEAARVGTTALAMLKGDNESPFYTGAPGPGAPSQATVSQSLTGFETGSLYEIRFSAASVTDWRITGEALALLGLNQGGIELLIDGVVAGRMEILPEVSLMDPDGQGGFGSLTGTLQSFSVIFTASGPVHALQFRALERPQAGPTPPDVPQALILLDEVSIRPVPEPTGSALLLLLAWGAGLLRRRKVQAPAG